MMLSISTVVVLVLAVTSNASVIPLITSAGLVQQTVDINGVRGVVLSAGPSANLVLASPTVVGGQALVVNPWGVHTVVSSGALHVAPSVVQVAPAAVNLVAAEAYV